MSDINQIIDNIVNNIGQKIRIDENTALLKRLGALAVSRLLFHLDSQIPRHQLVAFYGLQFCWSKEALDAMTQLLQSDDKDLRQNAAIVISKGEGIEGLAKCCAPLIDHQDKAIAIFALQYVESVFPDYEKVKKIIKDPEIRIGLWKYLPRYYSSALSADTMSLLQQGLSNNDVTLINASIASLINQQDHHIKTRLFILTLLKHQNAAVREMSAEYFLWFGQVDETTVLQACFDHETDEYTHAALNAAILKIKQHPFNPHTFTQMNVEIMEPRWAFIGEDADDVFIQHRENRLKVLGQRYHIPYWLNSDINDAIEKSQALPVNQMISPLRDFIDAERTSYGKHMGTDAKGFEEMVHIADDMGWFCDHRTVVSIADGTVRLVTCAKTWGHYVVIEHEIEKNSDLEMMVHQTIDVSSFAWGIKGSIYGAHHGLMVCSLYAHLGPNLTVMPGQLIQKGERIGTIGRSYTWENGGYDAHLHFGIHLGPYQQCFQTGSLQDVNFQGRKYLGRVIDSNTVTTVLTIPYGYYWRKVHLKTEWIRGYLSKTLFDLDEHGWLEPQKLFR